MASPSTRRRLPRLISPPDRRPRHRRRLRHEQPPHFGGGVVEHSASGSIALPLAIRHDVVSHDGLQLPKVHSRLGASDQQSVW